jgi:hypothetical protein
LQFSEIPGRPNGVSTPIGGVSWTPPEFDVAVARRVLVFLEDRRVLYWPFEAETPEDCVASVLEMRRFLTEQLAVGGIGDDLRGPLRGMRAACRKFLEDTERDAAKHLGWGTHWPSGPGAWVFNQAIGEIGGVVGVHVAQIAVRYGFGVPETLDVIVPASDDV